MEEIVVPLSFFLALFAIIYIWLTTRNKERMALIEKGADPALFKSGIKISGYSTFKWGLFLIGIALGLLLGALFAQYSTLDTITMYFAMVLVFGGVALVIAYLVKGKLEKKKE